MSSAQLTVLPVLVLILTEKVKKKKKKNFCLTTKMGFNENRLKTARNRSL